MPPTTFTTPSATTSTSVPSTTSSMQCCPANGAWTDWAQTTTCGDTCGSCATITKKRSCASEEYGCPCFGNATKSELCGLSPCKFPRNSCCGTYKAMSYKGKIICGPLPPDTDTTTPAPPTCCSPGGAWSAWSKWSACSGTCGKCGSASRNRTCLTTASGCPCTGDADENRECFVKGVWGDWVIQSQCNGTCGGCGTMVFNRTCLSTDCDCEYDCLCLYKISLNLCLTEEAKP
uniref:Uncharacterized protein n=1 Tax=Panagrolaimus superbus TaxID=310955 RepID=A0A914Y335_9BILA